MEKILSFANTFHKNQDAGQSSLFGDSTAIQIGDIELEKTKPADQKQRLSWERELLGMYISEHPLSTQGHLLEPNRTKTLIEIKDNLENEFVRVSGIITSVQKILTRANQNMAFAKLEDLTGNVEILGFPKVLEANPLLWTADKIVAIDGYVSFKDGAPKILAEAIYELSDGISIPAFEQRAKKTRWNGNKGNNGGWNGNGGGGGSGFSSSSSSSSSSQSSTPFVMKPVDLLITVPKGSDKNILQEIKEIIIGHPGESNVTLKIPNNGDGWKEIKIKTKVAANPVLYNQLKALVGKENVS